MVQDPGLRARKKRATRQHISDTATLLFATHGFDAVSVEAIAEAAGVSKKTVFNYFRRKEDLLFDRQEDFIALLTHTIQTRPPEESPVRAVRRLWLHLTAQGAPLAGVIDGAPAFWQLVVRSPSLRARARELAEEADDALAQVLAHEAGVAPHDPLTRAAAGMMGVVLRTAITDALRRLMAGERAEDIRVDQLALIERLFDQLEAGLGR